MKRLKLFSVLIVIGIIGFLLYNQTSDNPIIEFSEFPSDVLFAVTSQSKQIEFDCRLWALIDETDVTGKQITYSPQTVLFKTNVLFDVVSTQTGKELRTVDTDGYFQCTKKGTTSGMLQLVGGSVTTKYFVVNDSGEKILVKQETKQLSTITKNTSTKQIMPTGSISESEIDSKIKSAKSTYSTKITASMDFNLKLKASTKSSSFDVQQTITAIIPAKIINNNFTPIKSTSNVVKLDSITPSNIDLKNYAGKSLSITIRGTLDQWKDSEGIPTVTIVKPDGGIFASGIPMNVKKLVSSSTSTYEFTALNVDLPKSILGTWHVQMHSFKDIRKGTTGSPSVSEKSFVISDSTPKSVDQLTDKPEDVPRKTSSCGGSGQPSCCNVNAGADNSNSCLPLKGFIAYDITMENGKVSGTIPSVDTFDLTIIPKASLVGDDQGQQKKVGEIKLRPQIDFTKVTERVYTQYGKFDQKYDVLVNGETKISDKSFDGRQLTPRNTLLSTKLYEISYINVGVWDIENELKSLGVTLVDGDLVTFKAKVSGSTEVLLGSERYNAVLDGMTFSYDMTYVGNYVQPDDDETCKGLSGEAKLECNKTDPNNCVDYNDIVGDEHCNTKEQQTGGTCAGLTSVQCDAQRNYDGVPETLIDAIKNLVDAQNNNKNNGNPQGSGGVSGFCSTAQTIDECLAELGISSPTIDGQIYQIVIYGIIAIIFLGIVILIYKKAKRS